jgi:four helix bundle protein
LGSQSELETQIELSQRLNLLPAPAAEEILRKAEQVGRMLHALMRALEKKSKQSPAPST